MDIIGDFHTHTIYSSFPRPSKKHAKGTIRENAEAALGKGLKFIGITEHGPSHYIYGVNRKMFPKMRDEVDQLNEEFERKGIDFKVYLGVEANIVGLDGTIDIREEDLKYLDYLVMGYHYGAMPKGIKDLFGLYIVQALAKLGILTDYAKNLMTKAFIAAVEKNKLFMISHPGSKAPVDILKLARVAEEYGVALEISTKHSELSLESLNIVKDMDLKFLLNSDAHAPEGVGIITSGLEKALAAGLDMGKVLNYRGNQVEYLTKSIALKKPVEDL